MKSFEQFSQLHQNAQPLLLANVWDVNSAIIFQKEGYKAIGTSSQAVAKAHGYEDGEQLPFEILFQLAKRLAEVIHVPLTVDLEAGYSRNVNGINENIKKLHDAGVVGINFEDTVPQTGGPQLRPAAEFQKILTAVADNLQKNNMKIFLNIRTDGFLLGMPTALTETLARIRIYENAGASGIFVPCITDKNDIKEVVSATRLPINVMCMPDLPDFDELSKLEVKRVSMGPFVNTLLNKTIEAVAGGILRDNNFSSLFK